jgi:cytochrome c oxidase subunit 3
VSITFQFEDAARQEHATRLGMWAFLGSELMFFAALFGLFGALRSAHPVEFHIASRHMKTALGTLNTGVLLTSSLTVVLAIDALRHERERLARVLVAVTMLLGAAFLVFKGIEYADHFREGLVPGRETYFDLYYGMTGLHALHVLAGLVILGALFRAEERKLELGALYWHFVDVVWLFLWPAFYLIG